MHSLFRLLSGVVLSAACVLAPAAAAAKDGRYALVIGNAAYRSDRLDNTLNDARAIGAALRKLGFEVTLIEDASQRQMSDAIRGFGDQIRAGGVGLFYYAGHGLQVKGRNYLIPIDAGIEREDEVAYRAVDVSQVLDKMETARNPLNLVILDACRDNPFARTTRSMASGLAPMDAPVGTLIAYATAPGARASDGARGATNGVYTHHLLTHMQAPGLKVEEVFKRVRAGVRQETSGQQIPWEHSSLVGDFYFVPRSVAAPNDERARERELWEAVRANGNASDYRAYLERYPNGEQAQTAAAHLAAPAAPAASTAPAAASRGPGEFSFSRAEAAAARERAGSTTDLKQLAQKSCTVARRGIPIRIDVVEQVNGTLAAGVGRPAGSMPEALATRLKTAGLTVGGGGYTLRGTVSSQAGANSVLRVNEVSTNAALELIDSAGRLVTNVLLRHESYAGNDLAFAYQDLVNRQANEAVGRIIDGHCKQ